MKEGKPKENASLCYISEHDISEMRVHTWVPHKVAEMKATGHGGLFHHRRREDSCSRRVCIHLSHCHEPTCTQHSNIHTLEIRFHPCIRPSVHSAVDPPFHPSSINQPIHPPVHLLFYESIHPSIHQWLIIINQCNISVHPSIHPSVHHSVYPFINPSIRPPINSSSIHPFMHHPSSMKPSINQTITLFINPLSMNQPLHPSFHLWIGLSINPFINQSTNSTNHPFTYPSIHQSIY